MELRFSQRFGICRNTNNSPTSEYGQQKKKQWQAHTYIQRREKKETKYNETKIQIKLGCYMVLGVKKKMRTEMKTTRSLNVSVFRVMSGPIVFPPHRSSLPLFLFNGIHTTSKFITISIALLAKSTQEAFIANAMPSKNGSGRKKNANKHKAQMDGWRRWMADGVKGTLWETQCHI